MDRIKAACSQRGWVFNAKDSSRVIADFGVSAFKKNKKTGVAKNLDKDAEFGRFIALAKSGKLPLRSGCSCRMVVFENVDRFSRTDIDEADSTLWGLVRAGVLVYFIANNLILKTGDENNHSVRILLLGEMARANSESVYRSARVVAAKASQLEDIKKGNIVRLGGIVPAWMAWDDTTCRYTLVTEKAAIIVRLVKAILENRALNAVCVEFNREKVPMMESGKQWSVAYMRFLLTSQSLVGTLELMDHSFPGYYPAVLTQEEFNVVYARFATKMRRGGNGGTPAHASILNLFPGRVICSHCGIPMNAETCVARDHARYYDRRQYVCRGARIGAAASGHIPCKSVNRIMVDSIELDLFRLFLEQRPTDILTEKNEVRDARKAVLTAEHATVNSKITKLGALLLVVTTDDLLAQAKALRDRLLEITSELAVLDREAKIDTNCETTWSEVLLRIA